MPDSVDDRLDRYLDGQLSGADQRELAQAALDDPELFDTLTAAALLKAMKLQANDTDGATSVRRFRNTRLALALAGITAVAAMLALVMVYRSSEPTAPLQPTPSSAPATTSTPDASAVAASARATSRPVLLTARFDDPATQPTTRFRTAESSSRLPQSDGAIVSIDDGQATIDLGALDGLEKGSELRVFRGRDDAKSIGRVTIATVFRERSRGEPTPPGTLQAGDRVEVAPARHLAALLDQASARMTSGDTKAARALAERAVSTSQASAVPADSRRRALERLGTFEHRDGALDAAAQHLQAAVDALDGPPAATAEERAEVLNELGAVLIERGNHAEAEKILRRAEPQATGAIGAHIANNLAALAALRGDSVAAESLYRSALTLAGNAPDFESDRRAIRENLEKLKAPR
jgi:tetratricopeptide (TPR) repeat protein